MNIKIVNVYNDKALPHKGFQAGAGESFHISIGNQQVLFDVGWQGAKLMHNLRKLKINPDKIDKLVLSHSHFDHTGGLPAFLNARTALTPIPLIAHPAVLEPNFVNILGVPIPVGFPALSKDLRKKVEFKLTKHPVEVLPKLFT
ncbi:MBL fold metallo-hydrolase, partial [bacterium]|nr:MBL fold metallo-hydrolase [bacterium]